MANSWIKLNGIYWDHQTRSSECKMFVYFCCQLIYYYYVMAGSLCKQCVHRRLRWGISQSEELYRELDVRKSSPRAIHSSHPSNMRAQPRKHSVGIILSCFFGYWMKWTFLGWWDEGAHKTRPDYYSFPILLVLVLLLLLMMMMKRKNLWNWIKISRKRLVIVFIGSSSSRSSRFALFVQ